MGQEEVLEVLEENKDWMIVGEIMKILDEGRCQINNALRRLHKHGDVMRKEALTRSRRTYLWKIKD